jgi:hypothetical protein
MTVADDKFVLCKKEGSNETPKIDLDQSIRGSRFEVVLDYAEYPKVETSEASPQIQNSRWYYGIKRSVDQSRARQLLEIDRKWPMNYLKSMILFWVESVSECNPN